jgi:hypothetical protein
MPMGRARKLKGAPRSGPSCEAAGSHLTGRPSKISARSIGASSEAFGKAGLLHDCVCRVPGFDFAIHGKVLSGLWVPSDLVVAAALSD